MCCLQPLLYMRRTGPGVRAAAAGSGCPCEFKAQHGWHVPWQRRGYGPAQGSSAALVVQSRGACPAVLEVLYVLHVRVGDSACRLQMYLHTPCHTVLKE